MQSDGKLVVVGSYRATTDGSAALARYLGDPPLLAASLPTRPRSTNLNSAAAQPVLAAALARWTAAGFTSALGGIQLQVANLGGRTLGIASGNTITLDDNAAGHGWFVDPTPWDDSEFTTRGNQGEQNRMDLLTVLTHEIGHVLGYEHDQTGVMEDTLAAGTRQMPGADHQTDWFAAIDLLFADSPLSKRRRY